MQILFTGASSFTGTWFAHALADAGHDVVATFRQPASQYEGVRAQRVALLQHTVKPVHGLAFGEDDFRQLIRSRPWDVLCHHAADVTNYKSPDFDVNAAVAANTHRLREVLEDLQRSGCGQIVLTGSVFESDEGVGDMPLRAFSPYGLSKAMTAQVFRYWCHAAGVRLGKFVIPNPFGPLEEPRFTAYLIRTWKKGEAAGVNTPAYVRDNIHVSLLALMYVRFVEQLGHGPGFEACHPSGYVGAQGEFARRFAAEMAPRLGLACELDLAHQAEFPEPRIRLNTEPAAPMCPDWNESAAWDAIADFYKNV